MNHWESGVVAVALLSPAFVVVIATAQLPSPADAATLEQQGKFAEAADVWRAVTARNPRVCRSACPAQPTQAERGIRFLRDVCYPKIVAV